MKTNEQEQEEAYIAGQAAEADAECDICGTKPKVIGKDTRVWVMCECCKHVHDDCMVICRNCYESLLSDSRASTDLARELSHHKLEDI